MERLTQEEAERCARAWGLVDFHGVFAKEGIGYWEPKELPKDPYFWFGRLWDRLQGIRSCRVWQNEKGTGIEWWVATPEVSKVIQNIECPCLALCEAIEKLTKED